jgi:hypothetical protein
LPEAIDVPLFRMLPAGTGSWCVDGVGQEKNNTGMESPAKEELTHKEKIT